MGNSHFRKFIAADFVAAFFVEADGRFTRVHGETAVAVIAGNIFRKSHKYTPDALSLEVGAHGHLPEANGFGIGFGEDTAGFQAIVFEATQQDILLFSGKIAVRKAQTQGFSQDLEAEVDHLPVFVGIVIYDF